MSVLCAVFDLHLLRKPRFLVFLLMAFCVISGMALTPVFIPPHAKDIGLSNSQIGILISIMACIDLVSKISMGIIADRKWIKRTHFLAFVCFLLGTAGHLIRYVTDFTSMLIYQIVAGFTCGQYLSMYAVILMEVIGQEHFKQSLGFGTLVHGISVAIFFPVAGLLRDHTGGYIYSFHLLGALSYFGGFLVLLIDRIQEWEKEKERKAKLEEILK